MSKNVVVGLISGIVAICLSVAYVLSNDFTKQAGSELSSAIFNALNLPALTIGLLIQFDSTAFFLLLVFVQWFLLGFGASILFRRIRSIK